MTYSPIEKEADDMPFKKEIRGLILALMLLSLGGLLLHLRIHPIRAGAGGPRNPANFIPFVIGLMGVVAVPFLLGSAKTLLVGYLINGMGVVIGTINMVHLSLAALPQTLTLSSILFGTMLANILMLLPKLFIGQSILRHYHPGGMGRMFTPWWWSRHFAYLAAVYMLGHFVWR